MLKGTNYRKLKQGTILEWNKEMYWRE